jgi:HD-GYP domain-containing protein (c-di-GMP phosphodiesterase class II)
MRYHHERWDGKGYPFGLKGEEIPLIARIISVADTYDAMVSTRPYRKGLPPKTAFDEIVKHRGTQFCPEVVDAFIEAFTHEKMGKGSGGSNLANCD